MARQGSYLRWLGAGLAVLLIVSWFSQYEIRRRVLSTPILFNEVLDSGLHFRHFPDDRCSLVPEDVGSGASWGDFDGDGRDDLFLVNFAGCLLRDPGDMRRDRRRSNRLYRNNAEGVFQDITELAGLRQVGWNNSALWFDYDDDGWVDVAVTHFEGCHLYRNNGDGTFASVTQRSRLSCLRRYFLGICAGDYDHDGDLDLYLCGYLRFDRAAARPVTEGGKRPLVHGRPAVWTNPVPYPAEPNALLRNEGDGTFTDVTSVTGTANPEGKSMQAVFADLDNDGWIDLFVGNDVSTADVLYHNQRDGTFREVSLTSGTHDFRATMGIALADLWHRGWLDLATTHWINEDHGAWKNVTESVGSLAFDDLSPSLFPPKPLSTVGWGCGFVDFDNDGWQDFLVVNGSTQEEERRVAGEPPRLIRQAPEIYWNTTQPGPAPTAGGGRRFVRLGPESGSLFALGRSCRAAAFNDFDDDGRVDVAVVHHGGRARLYSNESRAGNWLVIAPRGRGANRNGINARVRVRTGPTTQMREILCGNSYLSQDPPVAHFGLGRARHADSVEVTFYPKGTTRRLESVLANQAVVVSE